MWGSVVQRHNTFAPGIDDVLDTLLHLRSSRFAVHSRHEQVVVVGVDMADGGDDRKAHSVGVECPPGGTSSHPAAATRRGGELTAELHILIGPANLVTIPAAGAHFGIGQARLRFFARRVNAA